MDNEVRVYLEQIFGSGAWNILSGSIPPDEAKKVEKSTEDFVRNFCIPFESATKKITNNPELVAQLAKKLSETKLD
jgi:hypothetical protein